MSIPPSTSDSSPHSDFKEKSFPPRDSVKEKIAKTTDEIFRQNSDQNAADEKREGVTLSLPIEKSDLPVERVAQNILFETLAQASEDMVQEIISRFAVKDLAHFMQASKGAKQSVELGLNDFLWLKKLTTVSTATFEEFKWRLKLKNPGVEISDAQLLKIVLSSCKQCEEIELSLPAFNSDILSAFTDCGSHVTSLMLRIDRCNNSAPFSFEKMPRLQSLTFKNCMDLDTQLDLSKLPSLVRFQMLDCVKYEKTIDLTKCENLKEARFSNCAALPEAPKIKNLFHLELLDLSGCATLSQGSDLSGCAALRELDCRHSGIIEAPKVQNLAHLEKLNLSGCFIVQPPDVRGCRSLKELNFYMCTSLLQPPITRNLESLEKLDFEFCVDMTQAPDLHGCKSLTWVNLSACGQLRAASLLADLPKLAFFSVSGCNELQQKITVSNCPSLEQMVLSGIPQSCYPDLSELERVRIELL
jgi:hypothetical protein